MNHRNLSAGGGQMNGDLFLQLRQRLNRLARHQSVGGNLDLDGHIVGSPGGNRIFGSFPNTVSAAQLELRLAGFAELIGKFLEQILPAYKSEANDARTYVGGDH